MEGQEQDAKISPGTAVASATGVAGAGTRTRKMYGDAAGHALLARHSLRYRVGFVLRGMTVNLSNARIPRGMTVTMINARRLS